jgi:hypothetical protein
MNSKSIFTSKMTGLGVIVFLLPLLEQLLGSSVLASYPIITSVIGLAIVVLRKVTTQPVHVLPQ